MHFDFFDHKEFLQGPTKNFKNKILQLYKNGVEYTLKMFKENLNT